MISAATPATWGEAINVALHVTIDGGRFLHVACLLDAAGTTGIGWPGREHASVRRLRVHSEKIVPAGRSQLRRAHAEARIVRFQVSIGLPVLVDLAVVPRRRDADDAGDLTVCRRLFFRTAYSKCSIRIGSSR